MSQEENIQEEKQADISLIDLQNANIYQEESLILNQVDFKVNAGEFVYRQY